MGPTIGHAIIVLLQLQKARDNADTRQRAALPGGGTVKLEGCHPHRNPRRVDATEGGRSSGADSCGAKAL